MNCCIELLGVHKCNKCTRHPFLSVRPSLQFFDHDSTRRIVFEAKSLYAIHLYHTSNSGAINTVHSTHGKRGILLGFLVALLMLLGQTTATPTLAAPSISAGISSIDLSPIIGRASSSPQCPQHNRDICNIIDSENDDEPSYKFIPVYAVDHYLFGHSGVSNRDIHPSLLTVTSQNSYRLTAIYMLTERFRL